jgi:hypothetical protein
MYSAISATDDGTVAGSMPTTSAARTLSAT